MLQPFDYCAPTSVRQAITLLAEEKRRARPFAGGTDILVQLRRDLLEADLLVDLKRIPELNSIAFDPLSGLDVGAAVTCASLGQNPDLAKLYPGLVDAASIIGGPAIRERATLGGNLCNAAPSGDAIPAMMVLHAVCQVAGLHGIRAVPVEKICTAPGRTILGRDEILVLIHFPLPKPNCGSRYLRFIPRGEMDIAVAGAGVSVVLNDNRTEILDASIALSAVAPTPLLVEAAGASLIGKAGSEAEIAEAARLAQEAARPITDQRGTAAQRRHLVGVLVRRALRGALCRAKGEAIRDR